MHGHAGILQSFANGGGRINWGGETEELRVKFNERHCAQPQPVTAVTLCETPRTEFVFVWLKEEAALCFADPTTLAGTADPVRYNWQPPNFLHYLQARTDTHTYIGYKTTFRTQQPAYKGSLRHRWGCLFIQRWTVVEQELVHVITMTPHKFPCKECQHTDHNYKEDQKMATLQPLKRKRSMEYIRISMFGGSTLFTGISYVRHNPYDCVLKLGPWDLMDFRSPIRGRSRAPFWDPL